MSKPNIMSVILKGDSSSVVSKMFYPIWRMVTRSLHKVEPSLWTWFPSSCRVDFFVLPDELS